MKMARHQRAVDVRSAQLPAHRRCAWILPDRVINVYDWRHQSDETKIVLDHGKQRADPTAITGSKNSELGATALAYGAHQLSQLHHALAQSFRVTNEIGSNGEFAVPIAARHPRVMIRQMHEAGVPSHLVEVRRPP